MEALRNNHWLFLPNLFSISTVQIPFTPLSQPFQTRIKPHTKGLCMGRARTRKEKGKWTDLWMFGSGSA